VRFIGFERFHADGLRVDAVAAMLYRDYSRAEGEWVPNVYGGRENLESVSFLQELRRSIDTRCPGAILVAEESTAWPGVTQPPDQGGLGSTTSGTWAGCTTRWIISRTSRSTALITTTR